MIYLTDFSTASKRLNLNNVAKSSAEPNSFELCRDAATSRRNPIQGTWGRDQREQPPFSVRFRSVGYRNTLHPSVSKRRDMDTVWQKSVIRCIRAIFYFAAKIQKNCRMKSTIFLKNRTTQSTIFVEILKFCRLHRTLFYKNCRLESTIFFKNCTTQPTISAKITHFRGC